jgi:hypothetical protein
MMLHRHSRGEDMPGICGQLAELLSTVQRPGDFYASGRVQILAPRLEVDGVGQVALPLLPVHARQLIWRPVGFAAVDRGPPAGWVYAGDLAEVGLV